MEEFVGIPVEVELASEFRYRNPVINEKTLLIAVSQSGETADTLAAVWEAKRRNALALGIVNVVGSSIAKAVDAVIYNRAGSEIGVASTKAFTSQVCVLNLLAVFLEELTKRWKKSQAGDIVRRKNILKSLERLPTLIGKVLSQAEHIKNLAKNYCRFDDFLYVGRKYGYPAAMEGSLKLREISYINANGCAAGEMKHGTIALIDKKFPTVGIISSGEVYEKTFSNMEEIKARGGPILIIAAEGDEVIKKITNDIFYIPKISEALLPVLSIIPLQLFAYYCSVLKGLNPDQPRNLAKSVTVE